MSCNLSHTEVSKEYVERVARQFVKFRADEIRKRREKMIEEEAKPKWYRPWAVSTEKAKDSLENDCWWSDYKLARLEGLWDSNRCVELVSLCMLAAGDTITLSSEDAEMLVRNERMMDDE